MIFWTELGDAWASKFYIVLSKIYFHIAYYVFYQMQLFRRSCVVSTIQGSISVRMISYYQNYTNTVSWYLFVLSIFFISKKYVAEVMPLQIGIRKQILYIGLKKQYLLKTTQNKFAFKIFS